METTQAAAAPTPAPIYGEAAAKRSGTMTKYVLTATADKPARARRIPIMNIFGSAMEALVSYPSFTACDCVCALSRDREKGPWMDERAEGSLAFIAG
jgi:hypothetical protein